LLYRAVKDLAGSRARGRGGWGRAPRPGGPRG
jgi:hypothetical protein